MVCIAGEHFQVCRPVMPWMTVAVIHHFPALEVAAQIHFCHNPVLEDIAHLRRLGMKRSPDPDIGVFIKAAALIPIAMIRTKSRTCAGGLKTQLRASTLDGRSTYGKSCGDLQLSVAGGDQLTQAVLLDLLCDVLGERDAATMTKAMQSRLGHTENVCNTYG